LAGAIAGLFAAQLALSLWWPSGAAWLSYGGSALTGSALAFHAGVGCAHAAPRIITRTTADFADLLGQQHLETSQIGIGEITIDPFIGGNVIHKIIDHYDNRLTAAQAIVKTAVVLFFHLLRRGTGAQPYDSNHSEDAER
jgi:hypothetical protein